jgi:hypothetical protein
MIHEDLQAAADQQDQQQEVDVVGDAEPRGKAGRLRGVQRRWNGWQPGETPLDVRSRDKKQHWRNEQQPDPAVDAHADSATRPWW